MDTTPNLAQVVIQLQALAKLSALTEQQLAAIKNLIQVSGTLTGPVATSATAGSETLPANPAGFAIVTIGTSSYKVPLYNT